MLNPLSQIALHARRSFGAAARRLSFNEAALESA